MKINTNLPVNAESQIVSYTIEASDMSSCNGGADLQHVSLYGYYDNFNTSYEIAQIPATDGGVISYNLLSSTTIPIEIDVAIWHDDGLGSQGNCFIGTWVDYSGNYGQ